MAERIFLDRHPYEYKLIGDPTKVANSKTMVFDGLFRLHPEHKIPEGYVELKSIWGKEVYMPDGRLNPRFSAVKRWKID